MSDSPTLPNEDLASIVGEPAHVEEVAARDTIVAIATPPGRGGIGMIRLSGPQAQAYAGAMLRLRGKLEPNRARFCEIIDPTEAVSGGGAMGSAAKLDEGVVTYFAGPRSYTGEDVVEIAAHGSPVLLEFLIRHFLGMGARLAEPGEFTERAFLAGRLDLTQAEAVRDLIDAQTLYQARVAAQQLDGALSRRVQPIKQALIQLIALMEAGIDFAEDDTPVVDGEQFVTAAVAIRQELASLERSFTHGRLVHAGLSLAIVGAPNVGKSSLFNCLVENERAIVTPIAGTTRDLVTERISLGGLPVELVDTAGLRDTNDEVERLGIRKSHEALAAADLVLLVVDAATLLEKPADGQEGPGSGMESAALLRSLEGRRSLIVLNKCDLLRAEKGLADAFALDNPDASRGQSSLVQQRLLQIFGGIPPVPVVATSARTGEGVHALREAIRQQVQAPGEASQGGMLTNLRQHQAVEAACGGLDAALVGAESSVPDEMLLLDLYSSLRQLDTLTGATTSDDVLNLIFSTFCIGK